jgi:hypothetical protein
VTFSHPREAAEAFAATMQESVSCVTDAPFCYPQAYPLNQRQVLVLAEAAEVPLEGDQGLYLSATHEYLVRDVGDGTYAVQTTGYTYSIDVDNLGGEALSYQWHPNGLSWVQTPHVHVRDALGRHLPTGRVSLEAVVRFLIEEAEVRAQRADWPEVLNENDLVTPGSGRPDRAVGARRRSPRMDRPRRSHLGEQQELDPIRRRVAHADAAHHPTWSRTAIGHYW